MVARPLEWVPLTVMICALPQDPGLGRLGRVSSTQLGSCQHLDLCSTLQVPLL